MQVVGNERHLFADHQRCLKCGKWESEPDADDCCMSNAEYDQKIRGGVEPEWRSAEPRLKVMRIVSVDAGDNELGSTWPDLKVVASGIADEAEAEVMVKALNDWTDWSRHYRVEKEAS